MEVQLVSDASDPSDASNSSDASLRLGDVEALALQCHPSIRQQRSRVDAARGRYVQEGLPFNPALQYQSEEIGNESSSGLHSVSISQQIVTANKLGIAQQVEARRVKVQQAQLELIRLRILSSVRSGFAAASVSQERFELAKQLVRVAEEAAETVEELVKAGELSEIAWLQTRVDVERARITAENAREQLLADRRQLAAAMGLEELPPGNLAGDFDQPLPEQPWEQLGAEILAQSPEVAAANEELGRTRWALRLACAAVVPNVTAQAGVGVDSATDDPFAVVGVSVPIPIRNRNQGNIRAARAEIHAASEAIDITRLSLQRRLANATGRYNVARLRYERLLETVVPIAQQTYSLALESFEAGETDFVQLLTAQRTLFNTRLDALSAFGQAKQAAAEIDSLLVQ
ncbi:MAG: TolC family protein [Planctomycetota bacterium]